MDVTIIILRQSPKFVEESSSKMQVYQIVYAQILTHL